MRTHEQACNVRSLVVQRVLHAFSTATVLNQVQLIEYQNLLDVVGAESRSTRRTSSICSKLAGFAASTTCSSKLASTDSCKVAENA